MNTPNEIVRADEVKEGDVLLDLVGFDSDLTVQRITTLTEREGRQLVLDNGYSVLRYDHELVRVRRPVPTVTIEVELNEEEAERALNDLDGWQMYGSWHPLVARFRDAIRAARAKETTP